MGATSVDQEIGSFGPEIWTLLSIVTCLIALIAVVAYFVISRFMATHYAFPFRVTGSLLV